MTIKAWMCRTCGKCGWFRENGFCAHKDAPRTEVERKKKLHPKIPFNSEYDLNDPMKPLYPVPDWCPIGFDVLDEFFISEPATPLIGDDDGREAQDK